MLSCKFCQHNVNWEHADACEAHFLSKCHVKNEENTTLRTLCNCKTGVKGGQK